MSYTCPICHQTTKVPRKRAQCRQLTRRIMALRRRIADLEQGDLFQIIERQTPAPACTICGQAAPGKPGQPTDTAEQVRSLHRELEDLERQAAGLGC